MAEPFWNRHRGPYVLLVGRPHPKKAGFSRCEWLPGSVDGPDVPDEAKALLDDPRDTIDLVSVFSESEQQFVGGYRK